MSERYKKQMDPLITNSAPQAKAWSSRLGALAADRQVPAALPTRLAPVQAYFRRRLQVQQDAHDKLRMNELLRD
jgi:hypothetical protein